MARRCDNYGLSERVVLGPEWKRFREPAYLSKLLTTVHRDLLEMPPVGGLARIAGARCSSGHYDRRMVDELETAFRSLDGTTLAGTVTAPDGATAGLVVLAHGGGVTRHEGGFFTRLAAGLAGAGFCFLRFDLRGNGASGGRAEGATIAGFANDIRAACDHLGHRTGHRGSRSM
ncbi:alpha/beta hydrolase [Streptomyces silvisoli]|uniref:alpha/beta hydrolase n=1 Tax=Streptomyces silvisoli TaxID=3034235 RepID=UPI003704C4D3